MRLWHYKLIPILPTKMLVSQWRECIAIKRQWEKGSLVHRLVEYVKNYDKIYFLNYVDLVLEELKKRNIKYNFNLYNEIYNFCLSNTTINNYPEHNDRYLKQCYYNLQEKYDRGIISEEEWKKIESKVKINNWTVDTMEQAIVSSKNGIGLRLPDINEIEIYGGV